MPMSRASGAGTPLSAASLAMTIIARMTIAPTERSMPAVRMMRV